MGHVTDDGAKTKDGGEEGESPRQVKRKWTESFVRGREGESNERDGVCEPSHDGEGQQEEERVREGGNKPKRGHQSE